MMDFKSFFLLTFFSIVFLFPKKHQAQIGDPSFDFDGFVRADIDNADKGGDIFVHIGGKILVGGRAGVSVNSADERIVLLRYNLDGTLDTSFGINGIVTVILDGWSNNRTYYDSMHLQNDNKIVVVGGVIGTSSSTRSKFFGRYNIDGSIDTSFGTDGFIIFNTDPYSNNRYFVKKLDNDQFLLLRSYQAFSGGTIYSKLYKYNSDGLLDTTFGTNGEVEIDFGYVHHSFTSIDSDGNSIYITGLVYYNVGNNILVHDMAIVKLNSNGIIDSSFGNNGITISDFEAINDIKIQPDGKILCVGTTGDILIMRFNDDGTLDNSFSEDGYDTINLDQETDIGSHIAIQENGKILICGSFFNFSEGSVRDGVIISYNADGTLNNTFGNDGIYVRGVSGGTDYISKIKLEDQNTLIGIGSAIYSGNYDMTIFKIILDESLSINEQNQNNILHIYPNPITESSVLKLTLNHNSQISINIFSLEGKLISTLLNNEFKPAGNHLIDFMKLNQILNTGVYILQVKTDQSITNIKIIKK